MRISSKIMSIMLMAALALSCWPVSGPQAAETLTLSLARVNGLELVLEFNQSLDQGSVPSPVCFAVKADGCFIGWPARVQINNNQVRLDLVIPVKPGQQATITYIPSSRPLEDVSGSRLPALIDIPVQNNTVDKTAPFLVAARVNGDQLQLEYNETLDKTIWPSVLAFPIRINDGLPRYARKTSIDGAFVNLKLNKAVAKGDRVSVSFTPLLLPLRDIAGNRAAMFNGQAVTNLTGLDLTAPLLVTAQVTKDAMQLEFNENLDNSSVPAGSDFTLQADGAALPAPTAVVVNNTRVLLTLAGPVRAGQSITLGYTAGTQPLRDVAGNSLAAFSQREVINNTVDDLPPGLVEARVRDGELILIFSEALDPQSVPVPGDFALLAEGTALPSPLSVAVAGAQVSLSLAAPVTPAQNITVSYTPGTQPIRDIAGNRAPGFSQQAAVNSTVDDDPPILTGTCAGGQTLELMYNEKLDPESVPAGGDFNVIVNGNVLPNPDQVTVDGQSVLMHLASYVNPGQSLSVGYVPGAALIRDLAGNPAASLAQQAVTAEQVPVLIINGEPIVDEHAIDMLKADDRQAYLEALEKIDANYGPPEDGSLSASEIAAEPYYPNAPDNVSDGSLQSEELCKREWSPGVWRYLKKVVPGIDDIVVDNGPIPEDMPPVLVDWARNYITAQTVEENCVESLISSGAARSITWSEGSPKIDFDSDVVMYMSKPISNRSRALILLNQKYFGQCKSALVTSQDNTVLTSQIANSRLEEENVANHVMEIMRKYEPDNPYIVDSLAEMDKEQVVITVLEWLEGGRLNSEEKVWAKDLLVNYYYMYDDQSVKERIMDLIINDSSPGGYSPESIAMSAGTTNIDPSLLGYDRWSVMDWLAGVWITWWWEYYGDEKTYIYHSDHNFPNLSHLEGSHSGDCANFASQALYYGAAGSFNPDNLWYCYQKVENPLCVPRKIEELNGSWALADPSPWISAPCLEAYLESKQSKEEVFAFESYSVYSLHENPDLWIDVWAKARQADIVFLTADVDGDYRPWAVPVHTMVISGFNGPFNGDIETHPIDILYVGRGGDPELESLYKSMKTAIIDNSSYSDCDLIFFYIKNSD